MSAVLGVPVVRVRSSTPIQTARYACQTQPSSPTRFNFLFAFEQRRVRLLPPGRGKVGMGVESPRDRQRLLKHSTPSLALPLRRAPLQRGGNLIERSPSASRKLKSVRLLGPVYLLPEPEELSELSPVAPEVLPDVLPETLSPDCSFRALVLDFFFC